jgi:hypothetical protein
VRSASGMGNAAGEHRTRDQARAYLVREVKQAADHGAPDQYARDWPAVGVDDLGIG